jgi:hypothetical protein
MQNAHFILGKTIQHGEKLVCSYPACRAGGVKFCMCTHCNFPVAKRNFRVRHHHYQDETIPAAANGERGRLLVKKDETGLPLSHQAAASKISVCSSQNDVERSMMSSHCDHLARHDGAAAPTAEHASNRTAYKILPGFHQQLARFYLNNEMGTRQTYNATFGNVLIHNSNGQPNFKQENV